MTYDDTLYAVQKLFFKPHHYQGVESVHQGKRKLSQCIVNITPVPKAMRQHETERDHVSIQWQRLLAIDPERRH